MKILLLLMILFQSLAFAEDHYPKVPIRYLGSNQGDVGDCMAHADVNALEHAFAQRGYPVKLSLYYRHAKNWEHLNWKEDQHVDLTYTSEDFKILDATGAIIPEYMWPENEEDNDSYSATTGRSRPTVSQQALIDPQFPTAE